jgi:eukaryotic-like serine/threonine-protein kinase
LAATKTVKVIITLIIITSSSLLSAIISSSQNILAQTQTEFLTYKNKDFGLGIQYPSGWTKEEESKSKSSNVNIVVSFAKQNGSRINTEADLYIRTEDFLGKNITLEDFAQQQKAYTSSLLAVSSFNESKTIVGNKLAWQIEYEFKGIGGITRHGLNSLMINDNTGYSLVFSTDKKSYDRYFPIAQKMVDSFHIKPN